MGSEPACYLAVGKEMYLFAGTAEEQAVIMDASGGVKAGRNSLITAQAELETCDAKIILTVREDIFQNGNGGAAMLGGASILCVLLFSAFAVGDAEDDCSPHERDSESQPGVERRE